MKDYFFPVLFIFSACAFSANAQQTNASDYIDIVKVYEKVVEDGYESVQIFQKLANTHYGRGNYVEAKKWFEKWFQKDKAPERIAYLKFSKTLQVLNETEKAKQYLLLYEKSTGK